jgi:5'-nucleotidase
MARAEFVMTLLYTSDIHSHFDAVAPDGSLCREEPVADVECTGGIARLATAVRELRQANANTLLVDAGDMGRGTDYDTYFRGTLGAELMSAIGYDAMVPGNHEFDWGVEGFLRFSQRTNFPFVAANVRTEDVPELANKMFRSVTLAVGGEQVGVVGVTVPEMYERSEPGALLGFTAAASAVQFEVDALTAQGVNKIIVLSHLGYYPDRRLAQELSDVDLIVGGHSHVLLSNSDPKALAPSPDYVNGIGILQAGAFAEHLGILKVTFDSEGQIVATSGDPLKITSDIVEDPEIATRLELAREEIEMRRMASVATVSGLVDGSRTTCRIRECTAGNLITDAMLFHQRYRGAGIALYYAGAINASIDQGDVTFEEVRDVLRYGYAISRFQASGAQVIEALEHSVAAYPEPSREFLQVSGIRFGFDPKAPVGQRVRNVSVSEDGHFVPLLPEKVYMVITSTTMREGRLGYDMFAEAAYAYDHSLFIWDLVALYLAENSPYAPSEDGRIRILD